MDPEASKSSRKRKRTGHHRPAKKKKKEQSRDSQTAFIKPPNSIVFARSRMFYSRAPRSVRGNVIFGLRKERSSPSSM